MNNNLFSPIDEIKLMAHVYQTHWLTCEKLNEFIFVLDIFIHDLLLSRSQTTLIWSYDRCRLIESAIGWITMCAGFSL